MSKSKKKVTKVEETEHVSVTSLHGVANTLDGIKLGELPASIKERFGSQIVRVTNRLDTIAHNLAKAIALETTRKDRETKKADRKRAREDKLTKQIEAIQEKLDALKKS